MAYSILHLSRNNQRTRLIVDDVTTLPVMFATIYGMNELSKKHLGTIRKTFCVRCASFTSITLKSTNEHLTTISIGLSTISPVLSGSLMASLLTCSGSEHLSDEADIISTGFLHSALSRINKSTYGNHVRNVGRFLKYLNYRYESGIPGYVTC